MKIIMRNSSLVFATNTSQAITVKVGNDTADVVLHAFIGEGGSITTMDNTYQHAVSPYIDITGLDGNITLHNVMCPSSGKCIVAFFDSSKQYISMVANSESARPLELATVNASQVPSNAKYIRFNGYNSSNVTEANSTSYVEFTVERT